MDMNENVYFVTHTHIYIYLFCSYYKPGTKVSLLKIKTKKKKLKQLWLRDE